MLEIRERLKGTAVTVIIDDRDQEKLVKTFGDVDVEDTAPVLLPTTVAKQVNANKQVRGRRGRSLTPRSSSALWTTSKAKRPRSSSSPLCAMPAQTRRSARRWRRRPLDSCVYVCSFARGSL
jgi:hypothetical protein